MTVGYIVGYSSIEFKIQQIQNTRIVEKPEYE